MASAEPKLRLYNTLTRHKDDFTPFDPGNVRMYVCGPTVYDFAHIGNARPVIVFDVLYRLLRHLYGEEHVTYVRNITDVDDKIMDRARERGIDIRELTEQTNRQFQSDMKALGCLEPDRQPRATETIDEMIVMIRTLIDRKHAYVAEGEVLFDVSSMPDYGRLSNRDLDEQRAGARVEVDRHKRNPGDFVLWKLSDPDQPGWDSPWGRGRPGWHIECSAMSDKWLWDAVKDELSAEGKSHPHQFDIHGGGIDLIFPHHENEIAQSRCAHGTPAMAQVWMHNGYLQVEGQKMSKSLGNFITVHDLLETEKFGGRKWPGEVLRLAMLMTHYREPIDFSVRKLEEAVQLLEKWERFAHGKSASAEVPDDVLRALSDDLDTGGAVRLIHELIVNEGRPEDGLAAASLLGIAVLRQTDATFEASGFVQRRLAALANKDFATADRIRAELLEQGIQLMDYKDPETGERRTKWEVKR